MLHKIIIPTIVIARLACPRLRSGDRAIRCLSGFGACPVLDTGVKLENDNKS